ncbi:MAG: hypothetical protein H6867_03890 [Rhodospirillales bacterium]|nr:hypothetical protein [Rhodospirillales bacterium]MCB9996292.1 hypothetical protein [Rhodospirillales bacterium]
MAHHKRKDVSLTRDGNIITLTFGQAARGGRVKKPTIDMPSYPSSEIQFDDDELKALREVYERGRKEGFFSGYADLADRVDCRQFCFYGADDEGEYRDSIMSILKGHTGSGMIAYVTKPCMGQGQQFQSFGDAIREINNQMDAMIVQREHEHDRAIRSARLGQSLQPLRPV